MGGNSYADSGRSLSYMVRHNPVYIMLESVILCVFVLLHKRYLLLALDLCSAKLFPYAL